MMRHPHSPEWIDAYCLTLTFTRGHYNQSFCLCSNCALLMACCVCGRCVCVCVYTCLRVCVYTCFTVWFHQLPNPHVTINNNNKFIIIIHWSLFAFIVYIQIIFHFFVIVLVVCISFIRLPHAAHWSVAQFHYNVSRGELFFFLLLVLSPVACRLSQYLIKLLLSDFNYKWMKSGLCALPHALS